MNAPEHPDDGHGAGDAHGDAWGRASGDPHDASIDRDAPMNDERCLFVLSLLLDGRPVEPALAQRARAWAEAHPECAAAHVELREHAALLAAVPGLSARPGFAARVQAAWAEARARDGDAAATAGRARAHDRGDLLSFVRRLAVAAGLALACTLGFDLVRPGTLFADAALQRHRHAADGFRPHAFGPQDIQAGLRARLQDEEFGASASGLPAPPAAPSVVPEAAPPDPRRAEDGPR